MNHAALAASLVIKVVICICVKAKVYEMLVRPVTRAALEVVLLRR